MSAVEWTTLGAQGMFQVVLAEALAATLCDENARLRAALEGIAAHPVVDADSRHEDACDAACTEQLVQIAKEALDAG